MVIFANNPLLLVLGLLALHTLAAALEAYYGIAGGTAKLCCDNKGALHKSSERRKRIRTGSSRRTSSALYATSNRC